jgi:ribosomal protein S18 acetylase RimI-like enzyme
MSLAETIIFFNNQAANVTIEQVTKLSKKDLNELCEATESTIMDTYGFSIGFHKSGLPDRDYLESYFQGVLIVPERELFIARLNDIIAGSIQLVKPARSNQTSSFACSLDNHFVAPWARGHKIAQLLLKALEEKARQEGYSLLKLSVRANREAAISLYEKAGYIRWGTLDKYELMAGEIVAGHFYYKDL